MDLINVLRAVPNALLTIVTSREHVKSKRLKEKTFQHVLVIHYTKVQLVTDVLTHKCSSQDVTPQKHTK